MSRHLYLLMVVWVVLQALWPASIVVIELWSVEAFCLMPVIACLFFVASVVYVGDASVSPEDGP
jgi:energy-coupling factor transporter transmembrane protein EcfT